MATARMGATRPIRRIVPPIGGLDLSPVIAWIGIELLRIFLTRLIIYVMAVP